MPELGTPRPQAPLDAPHVSTSYWNSFESRMRRRRAERCVLRAEAALAAGDEAAAVAALAEAHELSPFDTPDIETLRSRMASPREVFAVTPPPERRTPWVLSIAAAVVVLGLILGGFALSMRLDRAPEVPASAAVHEPAIPPSTSAELHAERPEPARSAVSPVPPPPDAAVQAAAPLVPSQPRVPEADLQRVAYTPPPPAVGTAGSEALPAVLGAGSSVSLATPDPPLAVPPEIPALPLENASAPAGSLALTEPPPPPTAPPVEPRIRAVLSSYEAGFDTLDATAVHRVWPGVDERSLARAFDGLASQSVSLGDCTIAVRGETATAQCQGSTTWAPKVGGGSRTEARRWEFALRNGGGSWVIVRADVR